MAITGLSMAARAQPVTDRTEAEKVMRMLPLKYPDQVSLPVPMPSPEEVRIFRVTPTVTVFPCSTIRKASGTPILSLAKHAS
jgi:hypothetical protein